MFIEKLALGVAFENYTQFYTQKLRYHRIFRDILILLYILQTSVYKQFMWFVILADIIGVRASLSATESCKSKDLQDFFLIVYFFDEPQIY